MKIMLLDDEEPLLKSLSRMITLLGHEVQCFQSPSAAAEAIEEEEYDFAFVDYLMPERDGIWFMSNARIPRKTKVMLMTAFVSRSVISRMFELGVCGYMIKPFDEDELRRHIEFHSSQSEPSAPPGV